MSDSARMARIAYEALEEKKAEDIRVIDITGVSMVADYFIVANGTNKNQINALVEEVEEKLGRAGYTNCKKEGYGSNSWVLMDFDDIIVHIFDKENRLFYNLERIWSDGKLIGKEDLSY